MIDESVQLAPLFPLETKDYWGFFLAVLGLLIAAGGGIGGGGILVPLYILILDFPVKHAISLSSVTVLGGALSSNLLNIYKTHPDDDDKKQSQTNNNAANGNGATQHTAKRPCVDWDLLLQLEPPTLAGTLIGAGLNAYLPGIVLVCFLLALLSLTAYKTLLKANQLYHKETTRLLLEKQDPTITEYVDETDVLITITDDGTYGALTVSPSEGGKMTVPVTSQRANPVGFEIRKAMVRMVALFVVITILNLLNGGPGEGQSTQKGTQQQSWCGTYCYWYNQILLLTIIGVFGVWTRSSILHRLHVLGGPVLSDIDWNESNTIHYPVFAILAGIVAGLFGIGGGIVKGPLMLELGVHPSVASATSGAMILFTSATATVSYSIYGFLQYDYASACFAVGFISALLGQSIMFALMKRYQRPSYIAYSIGIVVAISAIAMTVESLIVLFG
ncbi:hypothetical protein FisN_1Lh024 [Fistulifera solaris]|uniref:Sulfite exporter TauE/SafE n=1 Tax=Fistulifera solaris TaxID=1519565 RepID=A0A1Z5JCJ4_FISSO|nr:hypothetical protein FisN_1Lh024 [Fistulifera solaris]|eukprot:GAX11612.1 hypothetical protein FisN_1Lh024 [Fistulifera solaris]